MTTPDEELKQYLGGGSRLSRLYREGAAEGPSPEIDRRIVAAARAATRPRHAWSPFASHWFVPASLAAVLVLMVGVYMFSSERGGPTLAPQVVAPAGDVAGEAMSQRADRRAATEQKKQEATPGQIARMPEAPAVAAPSAGAVRSEENRVPSAPAEAARSASPEPLAAARDAGGAEVAKRKAPAAKAAVAGAALADVISVQISGSPGAYQFNVGVRSRETGCQQYADWWEVVSEDGRLLYRRVLAHSHVDEQPFARSGGPVPIQSSTVVWVRAHMKPGGYGGVAFKGSPAGGFRAAPLAPDFAAEIATVAPLPDGCAF